MLKKIYSSILLSFLAFAVTAQGLETFSNSNAGVSSAYTSRNWVSDIGLSWNAESARNDEGGGSSSITGMNGDYMIVRNTTGIIKSLAIPNGCGEVTFKYAKAFTASGNIPTFGLFINNVQIGNTITASSNAATTANFTVNVSGSFDLEIRQLTANDQGRLGIDDISWTAFTNNPPCTEPQSQPTSLILNSTPTSITGNFTGASPDAEHYLVVRSTSATLSASPADGVNYALGAALGNGTVVAHITDPFFTDINLAPSTLYYYFIFSYNSEDCSGGPNYLISAPLTGSIATQAIPPCVTPAAPTALNLSPANNFISGNFSAASGAGKYLVVISNSSTLSTSPTNGIEYTQGQAFGNGTVVSFENNTSFTATGLNANTTYYFFIFSAATECTGAPFYSNTTLQGNATTTNTSTGIPNGYYNTTTGLTCQPLKTALKNIISTGYSNIGYDGLWTAYQKTDLKPSTNLIWDIYTDDNDFAVPETYNFTYSTNQCGNYNSEGDCYNREHSMPKSWFNDASPMHNDIFHVMPTDGYVNNARGNYPYGEVSSWNYQSIDNQSRRGTGSNYGYSGIVFQPHAAFRGDVARNMLYMATRYEDQIISQNWAGNSEASVAMLSAGEMTYTADRRKLQIFDDWFLKTMVKWHTEDPVSQKEIDRNNAVYYQSGQNNRNPFIDHPEYVAMIWQCTGVLPVITTNFTVQKWSSSAMINWTSTYETNFKNYSVERSTDGIQFFGIGTVAGQNLNNYSFEDPNLPTSAIVYYRLKLTDLDGTANYSKIIALRLNNAISNALLYPNPTLGPISIALTDALKRNSQLIITDIAGRILKQVPVAIGTLKIELNLQSLAGGRYFISLSDGVQNIRQSVVIAK